MKKCAGKKYCVVVLINKFDNLFHCFLLILFS